MVRVHRKETYNQTGEVLEVVETPWSRSDYLKALDAVDAEITPRRLSDAARGVAGAVQWLESKEIEKQALRDEMNALG